MLDIPLYNKFIIFVPHYEDTISEILKCIEKQNYNNFQVYIVTNKNNTNNNDNLVDYIKYKNNYQLLFEENSQDLYSKGSSFFDYIKNNIENYNANDIILLLNKDAYLLENTLLIINNYYLQNKCWVTLNDNKIQSFKLGLLNYYNKNNEIQNIIKLVNKNKIIDIIEISENIKDINIDNQNNENHDNIKEIKETIHLILATYNRNEFLEKIFTNLREQNAKNKIYLHLINNNTEEESIKYVENLVNIFNKCRENSNLIIKHVINKYNYHAYYRIYYMREIYKKYICDYIIQFDDDQIYDNSFIKNFYDLKKPLEVSSWYGKQFTTNKNYWNHKMSFDEIIKKSRKEINTWKYFGPGGCIMDISLFLYNEIYNFDSYDSNIIKIDDLWLSFIFDKFLNIKLNRHYYIPSEFLARNKPDKCNTWVNEKNSKQNLLLKLNNDYEWNIIGQSDKFITLNTYFDKVYVLNLKKDVKKRNKIIEQFNNLNIICEIFEGHNGKECQDCIDFAKEYKNRKINDPRNHPLQNRFISDSKYSRFLIRSEGTLGIIKSMIALLKDAKKNNYEKILVFQDDILFDKQFNIKFNNIIRKIPRDWNILNLSSLQWNNNNIKYHNGYYESKITTYGAHAQAINNNMYNVLLDKLKQFNISYDTFLSNDIYTNKKYKCYTIYPNICIQDITSSNSGMINRDLIEKIDIYNPKNLKWNLDSTNYKNYWDVKVNIIYHKNNTINEFLYENYQLFDIEEINNILDNEYIIYINNYNSNNYFDNNIIGDLLEKIKLEGKNMIYSNYFEIDYYDENNKELMDIYLKYYNNNKIYNNCHDAIIFKNKEIYNKYINIRNNCNLNLNDNNELFKENNKEKMLIKYIYIEK